MSLIPNKKNKKDSRPGGGGTGVPKPNQQNQKSRLIRRDCHGILS